MKVPVGLQTIVGYGLAACFGIIAGLEALESSGSTPGSVKWLAIISAALAAFTNHNRSNQAQSLGAPSEPPPEPPAAALDTTPPSA